MVKCSDLDVLEKAKTIGSFLPESPDYWIELLRRGTIIYVLTPRGLKAYSIHREYNSPFLSLEEIPVNVLPKKVKDLICSSSLLNAVIREIKEFLENNSGYLEKSIAEKYEEKIKQLEQLLKSNREESSGPEI